MKKELISRFIDECAAQSHKYERLSMGFIRDCVAAGADGLGILALAIGVANMGVQLTDEVPPDPIDRDWIGMGAGRGKHLTDHKVGGLGIAHYDSGSLRKIYRVWGYPDIPTSECGLDYNSILRSKWKTPWLEWASQLVERREFLVWSVEYWLMKYWQTAVQRNGDQSLVIAVLNARISNSASGVGKRLAGKPWDEQAKGYVDYKTERSERAAERARKQVLMCRRVLALYVRSHLLTLKQYQTELEDRKNARKPN